MTDPDDVFPTTLEYETNAENCHIHERQSLSTWGAQQPPHLKWKITSVFYQHNDVIIARVQARPVSAMIVYNECLIFCGQMCKARTSPVASKIKMWFQSDWKNSTWSPPVAKKAVDLY